MATRPRRPWPRRLLLGAVLILISGTALVTGSGIGVADGPITFSNTTSIAIPATGSANQTGPASPYPSTINVSGMNGLVSAVTVTFTGVTHGILQDIDALLVAPTGANLTVMSDAGPTNTLRIANNATYTFDDTASSSILDVTTVNVPSGTYRPTGPNGTDSFPAPAPTPSSQTTFAGAFAGINPNGDWKLYVVDDTSGDVGSMSGGWSLEITTEVAAVATTTTVATSGSPSTTGSSVTFTATVRAGATPVTSGTVQFRDGAAGPAIGAPVPLNGSGTASVTTSALAEGTHSITATYNGASGFFTSNGAVTQRVDNVTTVTGSTFCNTGVITTPDKGTAAAYPSHITVSGIAGTASAVSVDLKGVSHSAPIDYDILLAAPDPARNIVLVSDAGGPNPASGVNLTFADSAANFVTSPLTSGTYKPTNLSSDATDSWPAPAPTPTAATDLASLLTGSVNGQWSLYVVDDAIADIGSISGGWCVTVRVPAPTVTALTSSANPSIPGSPVTLTATVTSGGAPVTAGSVTFTDGSTAIGGPVNLSAAGVASLTTPFTAGSHSITAAYAGTDDFAPSSGSLTQIANPVATVTALTSSANPSTPGSPVTLTAAVTAGGSPVTAGTVTFADGGTQLGSAVTVSAAGVATFTGPFTAGSHSITASYSGTATFAASSGTLTQVAALVADAGGPYTVAEGESLTLAGSGTSGATFGWDLNDDGDFTDASGASPTLTWDDLQALGIDDGPATHTVTMQASLNGGTATDTASLAVTNTAPDTVLTGGLTAMAGQPFTIKVGADDPSDADMAATFTYTIDWGDGSPIETVTGPADPPVSHTYDTAGTVAASFTATDKDGGTSEPNEVDVVVAEAPPTTPPTSTSETSTSETSTSETSTSETSTSETSTSETSTSETTGTADPGTTTTGRTVSGVIIVVRPATSTSPATYSTSGSSELASTGENVDRGLLVAAALLAAGASLIAASRVGRRGRHQ